MDDQVQDDPFAELEARAKKEQAEAAAAKAFSHARARLVLGRDASHAFFAALALRLEPLCEPGCGTGWTDGKRLAYDPAWLNGLTPAQAKGFVAHEVGHNALQHVARCRAMRDPKKANVAADAPLNAMLLDAGFELPPGAIVAGRPCRGGAVPPEWSAVIEKSPRNVTMEKLYDLLPDLPGQGGGQGEGEGPGDPNPDPGGCGGMRPPGDGSESAARQAEAEWREAVAGAVQQARQRGALPAALAGLVEEVLHPRPDAAEVLRQFVSRHAAADYDWSRPNRRLLSQDLYLPGRHSETVGEVVFAVDCSGSVDDDMLRRLAEQMQGTLEAFPGCKLTIVYHDTQPHQVQTWAPEDGPLELRRPCGGGTSHRWLPDWLRDHDGEPSCLVALTDGYTSYPEPLDVPTLWVIAGGHRAKPPFGQIVEVE